MKVAGFQGLFQGLFDKVPFEYILPDIHINIAFFSFTFDSIAFPV